MKKLGLLIASVFVLSAFSATAQNYEELLQQAQQYEAQKKWVHALGTYWDAMEIGSSGSIEQAEKIGEAAIAYDKLRSTLAKGNPGYGEFDEFDMYSNWIALLKEFEQYWSENTPVYFSFGEIKKGDLDFSTRTASYSVFVTLEETQKYVSITNAVKGGLKAAKKQDWKGIPEAWPVYSIYTDDKPGKNKDGVLLALLDSRRLSGIRPASLFCITPIPYEHCNPTMYEVTFSITDETGKELLKSDRHIIYEGSSGDKNDPEWYTFNGVPQDVMKVIDAGQARIALTGVYLKYGFVRSVGYIVNDRWTFDKSPERQEDVSKIRFEQKGVTPAQNMDVLAVMNKYFSIENERKEQQQLEEERARYAEKIRLEKTVQGAINKIKTAMPKSDYERKNGIDVFLKDVVTTEDIQKIREALLTTKALINLLIYDVTDDATGLEKIDDRAFNDCKSLKYIKLPSSITNIGAYAFSGCSNLSGIELRSKLISIGDVAFYRCTSLKRIGFPSTLEYIGVSAFSESGLEEVELSGNVKTVGRSAFKACSSLTDVEITGDGYSIGSSAFYNCDALKRITLSAGVTSVGKDAFKSEEWVKNNRVENVRRRIIVNYRGSEKQWKKIKIEKPNDTLLKRATINYDYKGK